MAIEGRRPKECFDRFRTHIAQLIAGTLPIEAPVRVDVQDDRARLAFFQGSPTTVELDSSQKIMLIKQLLDGLSVDELKNLGLKHDED